MHSSLTQRRAMKKFKFMEHKIDGNNAVKVFCEQLVKGN